MNTPHTDSELDTRIAASLRDRVADLDVAGIDASDALAFATTRAHRQVRRHRAFQAVVAVGLVGASVAGVAAVRQMNGNRTTGRATEVQIDGQAGSELRLYPTWLPKGVGGLVRVELERQYRPGSQVVGQLLDARFTVTVEEAGKGLPGLEKSIADYPSVSKGGTAPVIWGDGSRRFSVKFDEPASVAKLQKVARWVALDADQRTSNATSAADAGIEVLFSGDASDLRPDDGWTLRQNADGGTSLISLHATRTSLAMRALERKRKNNETVRDHPASAVSIGSDRNSIAWTENDWSFQIAGSYSVWELRKIANSLTTVDAARWSELLQKSRLESIVATTDPIVVVQSGTVGDHTWSIVVARGSSNGCVNTEIWIDDDRELVCAPMSGDRVTWSATRNVGDTPMTFVTVADGIDVVAGSDQSAGTAAYSFMVQDVNTGTYARLGFAGVASADASGLVLTRAADSNESDAAGDQVDEQNESENSVS